MSCTECGNPHTLWPSQVKLCDACMAKADPVKLVGKPVTLIWEDDWSRLVTQVFGKPYQFQQQGEMHGQNSIYAFTVPENFDDWDIEGVDRDIQEWLTKEMPRTETHPAVKDGQVVYVERDRDEWPPRDLTVKLWWLRENYPDFDVVMCALARKGLIDPGEYALHIWW